MGSRLLRVRGTLPDELFPGWSSPLGHDDLVRPLAPADDDRFWALDFHFPRGLTPLGLTTFAPAYAAGTRAGARRLGTPTSDGFSIRTAGPHLYVSPRRPDPDEQRRREQGYRARLDRELATFRDRWTSTAASLDAEAATLLDAPPPTTAAEAADAVGAAVVHEARAWRVHFEEMYVVLAGHLAYREAAGATGVPPALADACLAGFPTRTATCDLAVLDLAVACRRADVSGVDALLAHPDLRRRLDGLLAEHGLRADGIADVARPSWREDPALVAEHVLALARHSVVEPPAPLTVERAARREASRLEARRLADDAVAFEAALRAAESANWIWWNEEHNAVIDLRATLPLRRAALAAGRLLFDDPEDVLACAVAEVLAALAGRAAPPSPALLGERRAWLAEWQARRDTLPLTRGRAHPDIDDPVLAEVFGAGRGVRADGATIQGIGVSAGVAEGPARVVLTADGLDAVEPGDVIVCEATSPNWGYAFSIAGAVVCDCGGPTTHAAICAREHRVPCVVSALGATRRLRDGQQVHVDGDTGLVRLV